MKSVQPQLFRSSPATHPARTAQYHFQRFVSPFCAATLRLLFTALALLYLSGKAPAQAVGSLRAKVRALALEAVEKQGLVGLGVGVVREGELAFCDYFGWEDREAKVPVGPETRFRWASISKPVTAVLALQLAREGKLDLDGDIRRLVPEFPDKGYAITARQLLGHQGGIVHYGNGPVVRTHRSYPTAHPFEDVVLALDRFKDSPLVAIPGTRFSYSTHGFILLSAVLQRAGGAPYWEQVRERIARPAGLTDFSPDYPWLDLPHRAVGYRRFAGVVLRSSDTDVSWKLAGGGYISTTGDLARFAAALLGEKLLTAEEKEPAWTAGRVGGKSSGYGLGFSVSRRGGVRIVEHSGAQEKTRTWMRLLPDRDLAFVLMTNSEWARLHGLVGELTTLLLVDAKESRSGEEHHL